MTSHDIGAIRLLPSRGIVSANGPIAYEGLANTKSRGTPIWSSLDSSVHMSTVLCTLPSAPLALKIVSLKSHRRCFSEETYRFSPPRVLELSAFSDFDIEPTKRTSDS
jgi:hypothetical protein